MSVEEKLHDPIRKVHYYRIVLCRSLLKFSLKKWLKPINGDLPLQTIVSSALSELEQHSREWDTRLALVCVRAGETCIFPETFTLIDQLVQLERQKPIGLIMTSHVHC